MPSIETLTSQARRLHFIEGIDFKIATYTSRVHAEKREVLELTDEGKRKKQQIAESLFQAE